MVAKDIRWIRLLDPENHNILWANHISHTNPGKRDKSDPSFKRQWSRLFHCAALVEESDALARIVAKNPSAPVSLLRVLSRSEDEATRKNVILNPFTPYDVLSELENQFTELFVNNPALESVVSQDVV